MSILYNLGIAIYTVMIRIAAMFGGKAAKWVRGRKGWKVAVADAFDEHDQVAWFHAASLGEFEQGRPVMERFRRDHPAYKILLTFFSPSGYDQKKDYDGADKVLYLPPDCPAKARYFVETIRPSVAIFIKYEFWYNYLHELNRQGVPVVFISALFRANQPFFRWYGGWFRKRLSRIDHFFVQDEDSAMMLGSIGIGKTTVSGDTRFDRVADILSGKTENKSIEAYCSGNKVLLAGSTWPPDEDILAGVISKFPDLKLIVAPHEVKEERIKQLIETLGTDAARYTTDEPGDWINKQVLVIDTIGILSGIYRYADIAYIGGAFLTGLHNIQEPAVNGMPVIFGPRYHKFREAVDLVRAGGAFSIAGSEELQNIIALLLEDETKYHRACTVSERYMLEQRGATEKIMEGLKPYVS